jgi:hypothetical protein
VIRCRRKRPATAPDEATLRVEIRELTELFRFDNDSYWSDLRHLVGGRGEDPSRIVAADKWPDEESDFLLLVLPDGRAVEVEYADATPNSGRTAASLRAWTPVEEHGGPDREYSVRIGVAQAFIGD